MAILLCMQKIIKKKELFQKPTFVQYLPNVSGLSFPPAIQWFISLKYFDGCPPWLFQSYPSAQPSAEPETCTPRGWWRPDSGLLILKTFILTGSKIHTAMSTGQAGGEGEEEKDAIPNSPALPGEAVGWGES